MGRKVGNVTDAELELLKILWDEGSATAKSLRVTLYPSNTASDRATVQKLLERLEAKQLIDRDRSEFVHVFTPLVSRDELVGRQIEALADRLTEGSFVPLISQLINKRLSADERGALRKVLNQKKG